MESNRFIHSPDDRFRVSDDKSPIWINVFPNRIQQLLRKSSFARLAELQSCELYYLLSSSEWCETLRQWCDVDICSTVQYLHSDAQRSIHNWELTHTLTQLTECACMNAQLYADCSIAVPMYRMHRITALEIFAPNAPRRYSDFSVLLKWKKRKREREKNCNRTGFLY